MQQTVTAREQLANTQVAFMALIVVELRQTATAQERLIN
jgi:hypothetical protein